MDASNFKHFKEKMLSVYLSMNFPTWNSGAFVYNYSLLFLPERKLRKEIVSLTVSTLISILSGTRWAPENPSWMYGYRNEGWHERNARTKVSGTHFFFLTCTKQRIEQTVGAGDTGTLTRHGEKPKHRQLLIATNGRI